ncbi:hypothetical protein KGR20_18655 [Cytobacillus oceanisediminis]|nr:hypothetical protein [Cytobacillus oceanisediminis]
MRKSKRKRQEEKQEIPRLYYQKNKVVAEKSEKKIEKMMVSCNTLF